MKPTLDQICAADIAMAVWELEDLDAIVREDHLSGDPDADDLDLRGVLHLGESAVWSTCSRLGVMGSFARAATLFYENARSDTYRVPAYDPNLIKLAEEVWDLAHQDWRDTVTMFLRAVRLLTRGFSPVSGRDIHGFQKSFPLLLGDSPPLPICLGGYALLRYWRGDEVEWIRSDVHVLRMWFDRCEIRRGVKDIERMTAEHRSKNG